MQRTLRTLLFPAVAALALSTGACKTDDTAETDVVDTDEVVDTDTTTTRILSLKANVDAFVEHELAQVDLTAELTGGNPVSHRWVQIAGPKVQLHDHGPEAAALDVRNVDVAAPSLAEFALEVDTESGTDSMTVSFLVWPVDLIPVLGENVQIGGSTQAAITLDDQDGVAIAYSVGNRFSTTTLGVDAVHSIYLPGFIADIDYLAESGIALVSMREKGIAVVDLTDPMAPVHRSTVTVNYFQDGITFAEGGGDIVEGNVISGLSGPVNALETDGETLWIADGAYGIHRTAVSNLIGPVPALEEDGTLIIDAEAYTLQYAGEVPWGAPQDLQLVDGRLFVAAGSLGVGVYDPTTLERIGGYNLYTDASVHEDWFIDQDVSALVQKDPDTGLPFLDAVTGMPDYRQVNFEVAQVWHGGVEGTTPWAEFDRYGRYYYNARAIDVKTFEGRDIAYVGYGLGGLVAVDFTGHKGADAENPIAGKWLGYAPAVPAHGPDGDDAFGDTNSLYPHYGAGMLKEAGVVSVSVVGDTVWFADHFAGFAAIADAGHPDDSWHGPKGNGAYDNDNPDLGQGVLGDHLPDYEFVTSYDMSPWDPEDHESLPQWLYEPPCLIASGEVTGHGGPLHFLPEPRFDTAGGADLLQASGGGGLNVIDIVDLDAPTMAERFAVLASFPTTDEIGAAADGSPTATIQIGHAQGATGGGSYLWVGDGPHGVTAWKIADESGNPLDEFHVVANSLQDEYAVEVDGVLVHPMPHASVVAYDPLSVAIFSLSQSTGLRRADVTRVVAGDGTVGNPVLFAPQADDLFEHNGEAGSYPGIKGQDHAYDVDIEYGLAYVADGTNGLTIYDLSKDPSDLDSGFVVGNYGDGKGKPALGRATGVSIWRDPTQHAVYAFVAAGPYGVGVVDVTDPAAPTLVKLFEPIKMEDDTVGKADGRCVDVHAIDDVVYFAYSSFGYVAYAVGDLIAPLPDGVDPHKIWKRGGFDYRPTELSRIELTDVEGYENVDYEALYMEPVQFGNSLRFYAAAGAAGLAVWDWSDPTAPALLDVADTVGEATSVAIVNGRVYLADGSGGIVAFK